MKKVLLIMLLLGGTVATTYAQRGWDRGRGWGHGHDKHYDKWERKQWRDRDRDCRRWDDDYYRPRRRVVYVEPAYYPVPVPVPPPPPRPYYAPRPRAVFHAGVTIVN
ncbi:hypothetical protein [Chitinophaga qingshengii]|uniref:Uncharacterized protein n=1 Tax=Chitinophaga qingshengii TaxID=1569794 RepID=A0ABR7TFX7_9BACT|nr:hypothetical protein [Chitinophaga qingshengii]MBC9929301.1 hypothetical protein [Chitinophaga qingshengii]